MTRLQGEVFGIKIIADDRMANGDKPRTSGDMVFTSVGGAREIFERAHAACQSLRDVQDLISEMHHPFDGGAWSRVLARRELRARPPSHGTAATNPRWAAIEAENRALRERLSRIQDMELELERERQMRAMHPLLVVVPPPEHPAAKPTVPDPPSKKRRIDL